MNQGNAAHPDTPSASEGGPDASTGGGVDEAMSLYSLAARLVDLQLATVDQGDRRDRGLAATREVLLGTRSMLIGALEPAGPSATVSGPARPVLQVLDGGRLR